MPAATSAPNTMSSSTSEIGSEVTSAFLKSWLTDALVARSRLASPASAMVSPGCWAARAATAFCADTTAWSAWSEFPATLKVTSADRPLTSPAQVNGDRMLVAAPGTCRSAVTSPWPPPQLGIVPNAWPRQRAWMSTLSLADCGTPGEFSTRSAWPAWPGS